MSLLPVSVVLVPISLFFLSCVLTEAALSLLLRSLVSSPEILVFQQIMFLNPFLNSLLNTQYVKGFHAEFENARTCMNSHSFLYRKMHYDVFTREH